ncbi:hypothetical protein EJ06DRAFT_65325 [Trichodelitschia bisporula]|uniref:Uncharacterized protein n=1 Tax=Trichodelitschia bisporula TaxID=703511 RepID=A0A6G1HSK1_9PEZI|nr:hypothetical protein EJ06DRAFT_65325 [Trichodelitschia bisporula]
MWMSNHLLGRHTLFGFFKLRRADPCLMSESVSWPARYTQSTLMQETSLVRAQTIVVSFTSANNGCGTYLRVYIHRRVVSPIEARLPYVRRRLYVEPGTQSHDDPEVRLYIMTSDVADVCPDCRWIWRRIPTSVRTFAAMIAANCSVSTQSEPSQPRTAPASTDQSGSSPDTSDWWVLAVANE